MIESRYQTNVVSPKGAAGAWQLMPSVAQDYGIDNASRFHFKTSTDVALEYLSDLYQQWNHLELALASYHAGSRRVRNALKRAPHAKTIEELALPKETHQYLKRLKQTYLALSQLAESRGI